MTAGLLRGRGAVCGGGGPAADSAVRIWQGENASSAAVVWPETNPAKVILVELRAVSKASFVLAQ